MKYERLKTLEVEKGTQQLGETLKLTTQNHGTTSIATKDLIKITGTKFDVQPWRVYLAPWEPRSDMIPPAAPATYASPTMAQLAGSQTQSAPQLDNMIGTIYAKLTWGAGGYQQVCYCDWPVRGQSISVSTSFLQVSAAVNDLITGALTEFQLATLAASVGPDPGGVNARPPTYTYPKQNGVAAVGPAGFRWHFQVPFYARSFTPLVDISNLFRAGTFTEMRIAVQHIPSPITGAGVSNLMSWFYTNTNPQLQGIDWPLEPFKLPGQTIDIAAPVTNLIAGHTVTIEIDDTAAASAIRRVGCMFELDLG